MRSSTITGLGRYIPKRIVTNAELEQLVDTSDEWIVSRTGIRERRIAEPDEASSDLAYEASKEALADAGVSVEEIDLIIVGTATPDMLFPATACILQDRLGAKQAGAFDVSAACTSWAYAAAVAHGYVSSGQAETVLVVGAETLSKIINWKDRNTSVLFGDSAGAVVLKPCEAGKGFLSFHLGSDGSGGPFIAQPAGGSRLPASYETVEREQHYLTMNGREVFKFAVRCIPRAIEEAVKLAGIDIEDVDWFIPHQAN
ncbi:MAG TPA: beta-ketoacyl-ACP synthase III, partial [bacterium]|nr:beta-ketoacyl-ACP synthase III [bacterium]